MEPSELPAWVYLAGLAIPTVPSVLAVLVARHSNRYAQETHHQVTANHHSSPAPTIPDRIDDVLQLVEQLDEKIDTHVEQADREFRALWGVIDRK